MASIVLILLGLAEGSWGWHTFYLLREKLDRIDSSLLLWVGRVKVIGQAVIERSVLSGGVHGVEFHRGDASTLDDHGACFGDGLRCAIMKI